MIGFAHYQARNAKMRIECTVTVIYCHRNLSRSRRRSARHRAARSSNGSNPRSRLRTHWSNVAAIRSGEDDELVEVAPLLDRCGPIDAFLGKAEDEQASRALRLAETSSRPVGSTDWLADLERSSGRTLQPCKRGPKPKVNETRA